MKKIIQEKIEKTYCDITGKEHGEQDFSTINLSFIAFNKTYMIDTYSDYLKGYDDQIPNDETIDNAFYVEELSLDICQDVAVEVFLFLCKKYPAFAAKFKNPSSIYGSRKELEQKSKHIAKRLQKKIPPLPYKRIKRKK